MLQTLPRVFWAAILIATIVLFSGCISSGDTDVSDTGGGTGGGGDDAPRGPTDDDAPAPPAGGKCTQIGEDACEDGAGYHYSKQGGCLSGTEASYLKYVCNNSTGVCDEVAVGSKCAEVSTLDCARQNKQAVCKEYDGNSRCVCE